MDASIAAPTVPELRIKPCPKLFPMFMPETTISGFFLNTS